MNITLSRILSLIPKRPDGRYLHGAKKEFATSIGYTDGQIISMWENGTSSSYMGKLHEIAMKYNVSVEWLRGETDDPTPLTGDGQKKEPAGQKASGLDGTNYGKLSPENRRFIDDMIEKLLKSQSAE